MRKFNKISKKQFDIDFKDTISTYDDIIIPTRSTKYSAGYDFYLPYDITLKPYQTLKIPTGIKALMNDDEFLSIYVRSSIGFKYNIRLCNQVGIIDKDYYNNLSNEGHIFIKIQNESSNNLSFNKKDKIVQGIFQKYLIVDDENTINNKRTGGLGSTNREV